MKFSEEIYLKYNNDVRIAVEKNVYKNGCEHYLKFGHLENRVFSDSQLISNLHFIRDYTTLVNKLINIHPNNYDLAMANAIGSPSLEAFESQGDGHFKLIKNEGLKNNMTIYDLACGSGRTASAFVRNVWKGNYIGADIIPKFINYSKNKYPEFNFLLNDKLTILSPNETIDILFAFSLFTHLEDEEIYLYMQDIFRSLKKKGKLIFSFLDHFNSLGSEKIFKHRIYLRKNNLKYDHLDNFLHRDFIKKWGLEIGFNEIFFKENDDTQAIAVMCKN
jgi:ubiquinone/menaquinone biosynthesis C-methylase UbiE